MQYEMGKACARNLAIHIPNDLEGDMGFQEDLLRLLFSGIACKQSPTMGATLSLSTTNIYIYDASPLHRPDIWFAT